MVVTAVFGRSNGLQSQGERRTKGAGNQEGSGGEEGRSVGPGAGMDVCECQDPPRGAGERYLWPLVCPERGHTGAALTRPRPFCPPNPPAPTQPRYPPLPPPLPSQLQASRQDSQPSLCRLSLPSPPPVDLADSFGKSGGRQISLMLRSPAGFRRCLIWLSPRW